MRIGKYLRKACSERSDHLDIRQPLFVRPQCKRFADDVIDVDHRARGLSLARERQQVADDACGALGFCEYHFDTAPRAVVERPLTESFRPAQDCRKRVVQFVRDAGDGLPERRHFFGLQ